jgi:hypothetical protein
MAEIGQAARTLIPGPRFVRSFVVAALLVAATTALYMWPFTVDDALISIRYARHVALGAGYRFDVGGPSTDGVTPLAWPFVLWPLAHAAPLVVLARAKALGLAAWLMTATLWGAAVGKADAPKEAKLAALVALGVSVPLAAYAVSGMETALATLLATSATLLFARPRLAALLAGLAASFRPEMLPWALVLAVLFLFEGAREPRRRLALGSALALVPFAVVCLVRIVVFGSPAPLALAAKPSDLSHGAMYAVAAALVSVGPVMAFAPVAAARLRGPGRAVLIAGAVHLASVATAGGDWMPFARLVVPVAPSLLYASVLLWSHSRPWARRARTLVALGVGVRTLVFVAPSGRDTGPDREALVHRVAPLLVGKERVASVDIGWVSAATEGDIVDLAGVTDPEVAALGGGHTSKRIDASFLLAKRPGVLLLYAEASDLPLERWAEAYFPRVVEARLVRAELVREHFAAMAFVPLGVTGAGYYVLEAK